MLLACKNHYNQIRWNNVHLRWRVYYRVDSQRHDTNDSNGISNVVAIFLRMFFRNLLEEIVPRSPDDRFQDAGRLKKSTNFSAKFPSDLLIVTRSSAAIRAYRVSRVGCTRRILRLYRNHEPHRWCTSRIFDIYDTSFDRSLIILYVTFGISLRCRSSHSSFDM